MFLFLLLLACLLACLLVCLLVCLFAVAVVVDAAVVDAVVVVVNRPISSEALLLMLVAHCFTFDVCVDGSIDQTTVREMDYQLFLLLTLLLSLSLLSAFKANT